MDAPSAGRRSGVICIDSGGRLVRASHVLSNPNLTPSAFALAAAHDCSLKGGHVCQQWKGCRGEWKPRTPVLHAHTTAGCSRGIMAKKGKGSKRPRAAKDAAEDEAQPAPEAAVVLLSASEVASVEEAILADVAACNGIVDLVHTAFSGPQEKAEESRAAIGGERW